MSSRPLCTLVTPLRREERSICPATILLEKLLEKLLGPRGRHEGSTRSESERGEEVEENEENTGRRNQNPKGSREGKGLKLQPTWSVARSGRHHTGD